MPLSPEVIAWKREQERSRYEERPHLELPLPPPGWEPPRQERSEPLPGSTVIVIEF